MLKKQSKGEKMFIKGKKRLRKNVRKHKRKFSKPKIDILTVVAVGLFLAAIGGGILISIWNVI